MRIVRSQKSEVRSKKTEVEKMRSLEVKKKISTPQPLNLLTSQLLFLLLTACCLLLAVSPAFAAGEEGHGESGMVWRIVNFAILAAALYFVGRYFKIKDFFVNKRESIKAQLEEARKTKDAAEAKVREFEQKLASLDRKIEEIYREIRAEGETEKKRIIEEAVKLAERIKEQARFTAEQEIKKAKEEIKGEIAKVAVEMAEEILRSELTASDHERLIKEYLDKVRMH